MKYIFSLERNIFMYNHRINVSDGKTQYTAICEDSPTKEDTIIFWLGEFRVPNEEKEFLKSALMEWSKTQGFKCITHEGKGR